MNYLTSEEDHVKIKISLLRTEKNAIARAFHYDLIVFWRRAHKISDRNIIANVTLNYLAMVDEQTDSF